MTDSLPVINSLLLVVMILGGVIKVLAQRRRNNPGNSLGALRTEVANSTREIEKLRTKVDEMSDDLAQLSERVAVIRTLLDE